LKGKSATEQLESKTDAEVVEANGGQESFPEGNSNIKEQTPPNIFVTRQFTPKLHKPYTRSHYNLAMAEVKKQERDFTPEVDALLPESESLSKVRQSVLSQENTAQSLPSSVRQALGGLGQVVCTREADEKCMSIKSVITLTHRWPRPLILLRPRV
jgi:hypothetical protein